MPKLKTLRDEAKYRLLPPLDVETYAGLKANIALNGVQVPVVKDEKGFILDGFARARIAKELAYECPSVKVRGLTEQEKRSQVRALNLARRQLDNYAKREIIADEIKENPERSNRWIARSLGVHHATVIKVRNDLTSTGHDIHFDELIGRDGKHRSATGSIPATNGKAHASGMEEDEILRAAKGIRHRRNEERNRQQCEREAAARAKLNGKRTWTLTDDCKIIRCDFLIADPPFGITGEPWEPKDVEGFNCDWCKRWSTCGADFIAIFWCQERLWDGRKWFDESLKGYEFQQLLTWQASNHCGLKSRDTLKQSWYPIFLYRRRGSSRKIITGEKTWNKEKHVLDCHVAAAPQTVYIGEDFKQHPCQKPVSAMRWLIYSLTDPGEMVCSLFAGVAPCGVAAVQLGRKYRGIEQSAEYRKIAEGRIAAYKDKPEQDDQDEEEILRAAAEIRQRRVAERQEEIGNPGISGHEPHYRGRTEEWLTPRFILDALGPFDLDPCASMNRPWDTARRHFTVAQDGLSRRWTGRVWLNPPYGPETQLWMRQMSMYGNGIVLTFARTDTVWFSERVWGSASALYFLRGRVRFCTADGEQSEGTGGAPSVLIAYDPPGSFRNREALRTCGLDGHFAPLLHPSSKGPTEHESMVGDEESILQAAAQIRQRRVAERLKEIQEKRQQSRPVPIKKGSPVMHGDCLDLIPSLENGSVSLVVTSPPYAEQRSGHYEGVAEEDYPDFTVQWMTALSPKMSKDGSVFLVIRPHVQDGVLSDYVLRTRLALREAGWHECEELIWVKPNAPPLGSKLRPRRAWESILWFSRSPKPYCNLKACGKESHDLGFTGDIRFAEKGFSEKTAWHPCVESFGKGNGVARITDVIVAPVGTSESGLDHPAVFPLELAEQLIKTFSQEGDLVFDCFCGSGQTLLAAKGCGRRFLGIEREEKYVRIALGRLR